MTRRETVESMECLVESLFETRHDEEREFGTESRLIATGKDGNSHSFIFCYDEGSEYAFVNGRTFTEDQDAFEAYLETLQAEK